MAKIAGWQKKRDDLDVEMWMTTETPFLMVWIDYKSRREDNEELYTVVTNFTMPKRRSYKTKKEARQGALGIMRAFSMGDHTSREKQTSTRKEQVWKSKYAAANNYMRRHS